MNYWHCLQMAFDNLRANKMRSGLTMLGVIIGVSAVIMMVAILQGASHRVTNEFKKLGSNLIVVTYAPDREDTQKKMRRLEGLKMDDVIAIREKCPLVKALSPEMPLGNVTTKANGLEADTQPHGVLPDYERMRNVKVARGRFLLDRDVQEWAKVCVIGDKVREDLFKDRDPLGQNVDIMGQSLTVVGVLAPKGRTFEGDADKMIYLPLSTVQKRILGQETVAVIYAEPTRFEDINAAKDQIWQLLMNRYDNLPGWKVDSFDNMLNSIYQVIAVFTVVMGSIAGLALLVGGIGIMNIMLVSVTERTREIGLRKAIGAKSKDILLQFLIESATVSGVGGVMGILIGTSFAYFIGYVTTFIPSMVNKQTGEKGLAMYVPPSVAIGAFLFSAFVGVFFGIYPAIRAARLDPIQALRHE